MAPLKADVYRAAEHVRNRLNYDLIVDAELVIAEEAGGPRNVTDDVLEVMGWMISE